MKLVIIQTGPIRFSPAGLKFSWGGEMKMKNPKRGHPARCVCCEPRRAGRGGQSCAYEAPGMTHDDTNMPDVHVDSRAVDDELRPMAAEVEAAAFTKAKVIEWLEAQGVPEGGGPRDGQQGRGPQANAEEAVPLHVYGVAVGQKCLYPDLR